MGDNIHHLIQELQSIDVGNENAKKFEDVTYKLLTYLFIPPLSRPLGQAYSADSSDRLDWVFPNHASNGFWATMKNKFGADEVLVECKNRGGGLEKEDVVQVRNYLLDKQRIGNFALITCRKEPSPSAKAERFQAFKNEGAMILFISDAEMKKMIWLKENGVDPTQLLDVKRLKIQFKFSRG